MAVTFHRRINWKLAALLSVVVALLAGGFAGLRVWQMGRSGRELLTSAQALQKEDKHADALPLLERYSSLFPKDPAGKAAYARTLDHLLTGPKGRTRVFMAYEEALREGAGDDAMRRRIIEVALEIGRAPDILTHVDLLRSGGTNEAWMSYYEGRAHELGAEYRAASEAYQKAASLDPSHIDARARLAHLLVTRLDEAPRAETVLNELIAAHPASAEAYLARARHHQFLRHWKQASADLEQASKLAPNNTDVLIAAADMAMTRAVEERATLSAEDVQQLLTAPREDLARARKLAQEDPDVWLKSAELEDAAGNPKAAMELLNQAVSRMPGELRLQTRLADRLITEGKTTEAQYLITMIKEAHATRPLTGYLEGRLRMNEKDWTAARDLLESALRNSTDFPDLADHIALRLAECYRELGNGPQELATYRRVLRNDPRSEAARLGIAAAAVRSGKPADAILEYRQLLHVPEVPAALARLLIDRNAHLPSDARDWAEVDELLTRLTQDPGTTDEAQKLAERAAPLRAAPSTKTAGRAIGSNPQTSTPEATAILQQVTSDVSQGRFDAAAAAWNAARRRLLPAMQIDLHAGYAAALIRRDRFDAAREPLDQLRRSDPRSFRTLALFATWHAERGECQDAHRLLENYADQTDRLPEAELHHLSAAIVASLLVDRREAATTSPTRAGCDKLRPVAIDLFRRVIQKNPERMIPLVGYLGALATRTTEVHPLDYTPAGWAAWQEELTADPSLVIFLTGRLPAATIERIEAAAAEAVRRDLTSPGLRIALGDFEGLLGRFAVAEKWYRSVLDVDENHLLAMNNLAWMMALQSKSPQEALVMVNKAITEWGPEPRLLDTRGCVYIALKEPKKAISDLEASLRGRPGPVTALHLAQARLLDNDRRGAADAIRTIRGEGVTSMHLHPLERIAFERLQRELTKELQAKSKPNATAQRAQHGLKLPPLARGGRGGLFEPRQTR